MIKSAVTRVHLENNSAVITAEFIVTASLRKCLKRTLYLSYGTHGIYKEIYSQDIGHTIGDLLLVMKERLKLPSEIYSTAKFEAVTSVFVKI